MISFPDIILCFHNIIKVCYWQTLQIEENMISFTFLRPTVQKGKLLEILSYQFILCSTNALVYEIKVLDGSSKFYLL